MSRSARNWGTADSEEGELKRWCWLMGFCRVDSGLYDVCAGNGRVLSRGGLATSKVLAIHCGQGCEIPSQFDPG